MKCSKCDKGLISSKEVKSDKVNKKFMLLNGGLMLIGGPLIGTLCGIGLGADLVRGYLQHSRDEIEITCPHCKAKLTLTNEEFNTLKAEIEKVKAEERKSKQNRIKY
mgnify:CR=1 FL=1